MFPPSAPEKDDPRQSFKMSYVTENCVWLSAAFTQQIKDVVARFYELADSTSPDAGSVMASDVFSKDAVLIGPTGTFTGSEGKAFNSTVHLVRR